MPVVEWGPAPSGTWRGGGRGGRGARGKVAPHSSGNLFVTRLSGDGRRGARLGGRRPAGRTEITLKLERVWNRKCWGGACAGRLREVAAPRRATAGGAALCSAPGCPVSRPAMGLRRFFHTESDKVEWAAGRPRRQSSPRRCECLRLGCRGGGVGVLPGAVRREQPPSLGDSPAEPGLAEERAHAPEERKRKVKERRAGAPVGAPRGCPGAPCVRSLRGRRGRTKAAAALGPLWATVCDPLGRVPDMGFSQGWSLLGPRLPWVCAGAQLRGLWLVRRPLVLPVRSLPFPSLASPPTRLLPQCGPPSCALFMVHTCCFPRRICERRSSLCLETSLMGVCESEVFLGPSARPDGFGAVVPHGLFSMIL
ncbi:uncharacterized protein LOC111733205 isoform X3 [Pteropus vampyrus]|uniref:Uncharacterized protein LOC111733205 isoform X1 n=1 Tax=Pteropus vampyrus TaxID=132908 RepID=A0A6P6C0N7_PTEVA|nr:uncharacterized protein LOC111733205 isoform X1 [Pteropus vampyrus]XP_023380955.1 uncharacterized protein LOC111733205 isoform X2 [Pteropus vampyrus]XP_023380956.1 uncharacterized protein LOC111733205 isoform X3 [Pteropus vampyrus]